MENKDYNSLVAEIDRINKDLDHLKKGVGIAMKYIAGSGCNKTTHDTRMFCIESALRFQKSSNIDTLVKDAECIEKYITKRFKPL